MQLHPSTTAEDPLDAPVGSGVQDAAPSSGLRRRLLWTGAIASLLLLLIFVPPLISVNRYRRDIARSMSESLGRPVHLDNVSLHLLPLPGFTLSNLVVSEDPAFGAEPTIQANTVEATLRLNSLWRRRVEFSTVHFVEPSINLVRNSQGRWNLANVLVHAARVDTAPTAQRRSGPSPRFPYIEATGGRVNLKLGEEKLPFSLTNADFSLWLPSANLWRVSLRGQPARTDLNLTDPGVLRIDGDLRRADSFAEVPVDLRASWHDVPLGEASRMFTGDDMGWRGTLNLDAELSGMLGEAALRTKLTLGSLRRAEFAPAQPFDLQITCGAGLATEAVTLTALACSMPDSAPEPLAIRSPAFNLQHPEHTDANVAAPGISARWALRWAALFSSRVPTDLQTAGTVDVSLSHTSAALPPIHLRPGSRRVRRLGRGQRPAIGGAVTPWNGWAGQVVVHLPPVPSDGAAGANGGRQPAPVDLVWVLDGSAGSSYSNGTPAFRLQPTAIRLATDSAVAVTGVLGSAGYTVSVTGSASPAALLLPARYLPQLGDGLDNVLPFPPTGLGAARVEFTCTRSWAAAQTCTGARSVGSSARPLLPLVAPMPQANTPVLLAPRSLSPYDRDPQLGGTPQPQPPQPQQP